ncbi:dimethylarginine dimethylaminohydrolase family protein [Aliikangiella coralliicola]|uniref:N(G),N(G)-dimethylarginine dimethylaminohydrolase n=1 Tax=Aliikangiella coralliicola TaxID=2592383 RepID=A0A545TS21_9GAMM|nr:arginine deiminase family protein [Aliikangiella coralliicola]TQV80015.1 N(G),N(G)-dimethylarginine dimethylaminohydrolase [Aliikangiella coralliicola]
MFTKAIVRTPCKAMIEGITTANLGTPDYQKALQQHADYIAALQECGLSVTVLPADENFPDSTFVEDTALMTPHCAIITNPGAPSRTAETHSIKAVVADFYDQVELIEAPGTVEAGDIMMVGDHYYIGLSERTNQQGADQMIAILKRYGMTGSTVTMSEMLHLKTGLGYLENNYLLACGEFLKKAEFQQYNILEVEQEEAYAANSVWVNNVVLTPAGFPKTHQLIQSAGYEIRIVDVSEFQKIDGGLSCLSLRF